MIRRGVMGGAPTVVVRSLSERTRTFKNPLTNKIQTVRLRDETELRGVDEVAAIVAKHQDFNITASGMGRPKCPPLPVNIAEPYYLGVTCRVYPEVRSTSDLHEESRGPEGIPSYGKICDIERTIGFFTNPHDMALIRIPGAGCGRFWIEFDLGNNLFPKFDRKDLMLLDPEVVSEARRIFEIEFVQGCKWG
jgi:hypothetical protein